MKNQILKFIILIFIYSNAYADITFYNDSKLDLYFESHRGGCSGVCTNPWYGTGVTDCCGDFPVVVKGKTYDTDFTNWGVVRLSTIAPAWTSLGYQYPVYAHTQGGEQWQTKGDHNPGDTIRFPGDFSVTSDDLNKIMPTIVLTQSSIDTLGYLFSLNNASSVDFTIKGHPLASNSGQNAFRWQNPSSKFPELWDTNKIIQIVGQLGNLTRTITLTPAVHSLTIQDKVSEQNVSPTISQQLLDLDSVFSDYFGQLSSSNIVTGWGISLKFTDQNVQITDMQIYHQFVSGYTTTNEAYWIYPDKVLKGTMASASAQPDWKTTTGQPTLGKYIHKQ